MSVIAPTITAFDLHEYRAQMDRITPFAKRIHIDLMDGIFAPTKSPDIDKLWLPEEIVCDVHVMYQHPFHQLKKLLAMNPAMLIIQAEADRQSVEDFIKHVKKTRVRLGISLLSETSPQEVHVKKLIKQADYVLIFSGHLGYHGGSADLALLEKVGQIHEINPLAEIGWDGGINMNNVHALVGGGIDVLNVGSGIQKALHPKTAYIELMDVCN